MLGDQEDPKILLNLFQSISKHFFDFFYNIIILQTKMMIK